MLPSDIARLVLMYLKDEGMTRSYKQFYSECPHLEELRRHPDVEPSVPFEKGLQEILNDYAKIMSAIKDRLNCNQLVESLWKMHSEVIGQLKFQYAGNAGFLQTYEQKRIDSRSLSRYRLSGLRKQQEIQHILASQRSGTTPTSIPNAVTNTSQSDLSPAYPAVNSAHPVMNSVATSPIEIQIESNHLPRSHQVVPWGRTRTSLPEMEVEVHASNDKPQKRTLQDFQHGQEAVVIPELRTPSKNSSSSGAQLDTPIGKSPKRKSAAPRKIQGTTATSISPRSDATSTNQWEDDLPEVLESLINNIDFQEKLAQNINKALPADSLDKDHQAEPTKEADSTYNLGNQSSTSIDDLLNLQMSDETIHDIVQKTSLDPAFESLFSLFSQNSEDGSSHQLEHLTNEASASSHDITDQSLVPATPHSNQSHYPSEQEAAKVIQTSANQNARDPVLVGQLAASSGSGFSANAGQLTNTGTQRNATSLSSTSGTIHLQVSTPNLTTSTPTDQVVNLPVILNQQGSYQVLQQPNTANTQSIVLNGSAGPAGGTIFLTPDGSILGTSNVILQSGTVQSVSNTQVAMSGAGVMQNAAPNIPHVCPVHGTRTDHIGMNVGGFQQPAGKSPSLAITSTTPSVNTTIDAQNAGGGDQNEIVKLLGSMVESDVGSFFSCPPEKLHSKSPSTSKRTPKKIRAKRKEERLPKSPNFDKNPGNQSLNSNNHNINHEAMQNHIQSLGTHATVNVVNETQHDSPLSKDGQILNPGLMPGRLTSQVLATSPEIGMQTISPPLSTGKQRKHIQFKQVVLSRTLDCGGSCETLPKPKQRSPAKSKKGPKISEETRGLGTKADRVLQGSPSDTASHQNMTTASISAQHREVVNTFKSVNQLAQLTNSTPEKVSQIPNDMSAEVNIAAQMLVCLSNSPPSIRQSPYCLKRLRCRSGCSPRKSPTKDHIVQLRKEIGLTPKSLQQKDFTDKTSLGQYHYLDGTANEGKTQTTSSQEQTKTKEANSSKRKSRTPRKQTQTLTETVVLSLPSESNQKSRKSAPSTIHTRAFSRKCKSPGKLTEDTITARKSPRRSRSPGRPTVGSLGKDNLAINGDVNSAEDAGKKEGRGQKRRRDKNDKEEKIKNAKNPKKERKSQGFPSNLDVDKFLSSLQYAE